LGDKTGDLPAGPGVLLHPAIEPGDRLAAQETAGDPAPQPGLVAQVHEAAAVDFFLFHAAMAAVVEGDLFRLRGTCQLFTSHFRVSVIRLRDSLPV
jgi:hypothetical protein